MHIEYLSDGTPYAPLYGDVYRSRSGAEQAAMVFVEGNEVPSIMVVADRNSGRFPIRNVRIENNVVGAGKSSIRVAGDPAENVVIKNNRHKGEGEAVIVNQANAKVSGNKGFREEKPPVVIRK